MRSHATFMLSPVPCMRLDACVAYTCSLGLTVNKIFSGKPPFHDRGHGAMFAIIRGEWPALPPPGVWSTEERNMWALVAKARAPDPTKRMKIREIKNALRGAHTSLQESRSTVADEGRPLIVNNENILNAKAWLEKELSNPAMGDAGVNPFTSLIEGVETPARESSALGSLCPERRESQDLNGKGPPRGSPSTHAPLHLDLWNARYTHGLATPISPSPSPLNPHAVTGEDSTIFFQMASLLSTSTLLRTPILTLDCRLRLISRVGYQRPRSSLDWFPFVSSQLHQHSFLQLC